MHAISPLVHRNLLGGGPAVGRQYVVTIGIDHYQSRQWQTLHNAVNDARGAANAFGRLGFESKAALMEERATRSSMLRVVDDLRALGSHDSLVVFFAGHGYTEHRPFRDGLSARIGYLVPSDAGGLTSLVRLDDWLRALARLPPRHILVILDCCGGGIALAPRYRAGGQSIMNTRSSGLESMDVMAPLRKLRSRRVITSALDTQLAVDSGPSRDHSLFTGCLIEALSGELFTQLRRNAIASSELFNHVRGRMWDYARSQQTPDFGALHRDERGELILEQPSTHDAPGRSAGLPERASSGARRIRRTVAELSPSAHRRASSAPSALDVAFSTALDRHDDERARGRPVLSIISAESNAAAAGWATWAAERGRLTLVTEATSCKEAVADLLAAMPWLRLVSAARAKVIGGNSTIERVIDDALLSSWLEQRTSEDHVAHVVAWLLSWSIAPWGSIPDLDNAPCTGGALLSAVCELNPPITVVFRRANADEAWLRAALRTAEELLVTMPHHAVAVAAPNALLREVLLGPDVATLRRNIVPLARAPQSATSVNELAKRASAALATDRRTAGQLESNAPVPIHGHDQPIVVDLLANEPLLAIMIDDWHRTAEPDRYREDRLREVQLQLASYYVLRIPADAIERQLDAVIDEVAVILAGRRL